MNKNCGVGIEKKTCFKYRNMSRNVTYTNFKTNIYLFNYLRMNKKKEFFIFDVKFIYLIVT